MSVVFLFMALTFKAEDLKILPFVSKMKDYFSSERQRIESAESFSLDDFLKFKDEFGKSYDNFESAVKSCTEKESGDEDSSNDPYEKQKEFMNYLKDSFSSIEKNFSLNILLSSIKIAISELLDMSVAEIDDAESDDDQSEQEGSTENDDSGEKKKYDPKLYPYRKITKKERKYGRRFYECIISFRQDKSNITCKSCIESIFNVIQDNKGVCKHNPKYLGLRALVSRIGKKNKKCHMYSIKYEGSNEINSEIESILKTTEKVVRYVILRVSNIDSTFYSSDSINAKEAVIDRKYFVKFSLK